MMKNEMTHDELVKEIIRCQQKRPLDLVRLSEGIDTRKWNRAFFEVLRGNGK